MDKKGAKGYWISTARIINQDLFDEYVKKSWSMAKRGWWTSFCKRYSATRKGEDGGC